MSHSQAFKWGLILMFMMSVLSGCGEATPTPIVIVPTEAAPAPQANPPAVLPQQPTDVPATEPPAGAAGPTTTADGTTTVEPSPSPTLPAPIDRPFLMKIDRISVVVGRGTLIEGRVANGTLQASDSLEILGTGGTVINSSIIAVLISNTMRDQVTVGDYAGILVGGVEATDVSPGMLVAKAGEFESYEEALLQLQ